MYTCKFGRVHHPLCDVHVQICMCTSHLKFVYRGVTTVLGLNLHKHVYICLKDFPVL
jgi:hypothetical protein